VISEFAESGFSIKMFFYFSLFLSSLAWVMKTIEGYPELVIIETIFEFSNIMVATLS